MASILKHIRSSVADKRPTGSGLADGQIALNTASGTPGMYFKDSNGDIVKVGPVHIGTTAPNTSPAGSTGNSDGEMWVDESTTTPGLKYYNGSSFVNLTPSGTLTTVGLVELATGAETQTGTDAIRAVTPSGLQSKVSDSISTTSSTTIASSTAVKSAYDLANAALPKTGGTITGELLISPSGSLVFEGSADDIFETTIAVVNPTSDRTITFPNISGTVVTTGDSGTVTSTMIADATIVDGDISPTAEIAVSKLADGAARQLLQTDAAGTGVEWASNIDIPGTLDVTSAATFDSSVAVTGALTKSGNNVVTVGDTGTVTSTMILDGTILNEDINASAAIVDTKLATISTADKVSLSALNIDGGTDIGTALADADLFIVDDGGAGANRKAAATRITDYAFGKVSGDITIGSTGTAAIGTGVIVNADVNASAAIAGTKISPDFGSQTVVTTGVFSHPLGAAATPSITFTGDLNTGIYSPGADQVAVATNGTGRLFVDSSGNVGVGVASDLGTSKLFIAGNGTAGLTNIVTVRTASGNSYGLQVKGNNTNDEWLIQNYYNAALAFGTNNTERLRITSAGLVGVGTSSPNALLHLNGGTINVQGGTASSGDGANINLVAQNAANFSNGGVVNITAGSATLGNANGGNIILTPGTQTSAGTPGYLGIGTSSPTSYVHAVDNTGAKTVNYSSALIGSNVTAAGFTNGVKTALEIQSTGSWSGTDAVNRGLFVNVSGGTNNYAAIFSGGNVGVGTTSPSALCHVYAGNSANTLPANAQAIFENSANGGISISTPSGNTAGAYFPRSTDAYYGGIERSGTDLNLRNNGQTRATIDSSGRVGIGTSTLSSYEPGLNNLVVANTAGSAGITIASNSTYGALLFADGIGPTERQAGRIIYSHSLDKMQFGNSIANHLTLDNATGNLGIGTTSPGTSRTYIQADDTNTAGLTINGINSSGGVSGYSSLKITGNTPNAVGTHYGVEFVKTASNVESIIGYYADITGSYNTQTNFHAKLTKNVGAYTNGYCYYADLATSGSGGAAYFAYFYNSTSSAERFSITSGGTTTLTSAASTAPFIVKIGSSEVSRIDSSGRLLVGTSTNDSNALAVIQGYAGLASGQGVLALRLGTTRPAGADTGIGSIRFESTSNTSSNYHYASISAFSDGASSSDTDIPGRLVFSTTADGASSPTERMRIGNKGITTVTSVANNSYAFQVNSNGTNGQQYGVYISTADDQNSTSPYFFECVGGATTRVRFLSNGGLANYSANNSNLSDINTKKDISPATDTWDCIKEWEIVNYRYKDQPDDADLNLGVIAQQVAESCPEVVTVFEKAKDDQPEKLGIKEQQMYWMAIKALQEAQVRIEALEAEVAALKAQ